MKFIPKLIFCIIFLCVSREETVDLQAVKNRRVFPDLVNGESINVRALALKTPAPVQPPLSKKDDKPNPTIPLKPILPPKIQEPQPIKSQPSQNPIIKNSNGVVLNPLDSLEISIGSFLETSKSDLNVLCLTLKSILRYIKNIVNDPNAFDLNLSVATFEHCFKKEKEEYYAMIKKLKESIKEKTISCMIENKLYRDSHYNNCFAYGKFSINELKEHLHSILMKIKERCDYIISQYVINPHLRQQGLDKILTAKFNVEHIVNFHKENRRREYDHILRELIRIAGK